MSGFESPNYTQTPNDFFAMIPDMTEAELRVTLVMIRRTFGFHRNDFKMGIRKLATAAGLSPQGARDGAEAAEKRGTFRRSNPDAQGEAEWELVVPLQPVDSPLNAVDSPPQLGGGQVRLKESNKENTKEGKKPKFSDPTWDILHGQTPTEEGIELAKRAELYTEVANRLSSGLRRGEFPQTIEAQKVYRWIAEREDAGQNLDKFIAWAMEGRRAEFSFIYHKDPSMIKRDWLQVFTAGEQPAAKPESDGGFRV